MTDIREDTKITEGKVETTGLVGTKAKATDSSATMATMEDRNMTNPGLEETNMKMDTEGTTRDTGKITMVEAIPTESSTRATKKTSMLTTFTSARELKRMVISQNPASTKTLKSLWLHAVQTLRKQSLNSFACSPTNTR